MSRTRKKSDTPRKRSVATSLDDVTIAMLEAAAKHENRTLAGVMRRALERWAILYGAGEVDG